MARSKLTSQSLEQWPIDRLIEYARNPRTKDQATGYPPVLGGETPTRALHIESRK